MRKTPWQQQRTHTIGSRPGKSRRLPAALGVAAVILLAATPSARGITVLWTSSNTNVTLGATYWELEFENPLTGTETVQGYRVVDWRDADYQPGAANLYDDWINVGSGTPDGDPNEVWMRSAGQSIATTTAPGTLLSVHLVGDGNDGVAEVVVDGTLVAQLDMGTSPGSDRAFVLVSGLPATRHQVQVDDAGLGQYGTDVAVLGAAVLERHPLLRPELEFSIDIGSDAELSDPTSGGNGGFEPGDVYAWRSAPINAPNGRDGFKDDLAIFAGTDIWPDPPDTYPPVTAVPMVDGFGPDDYGTDWFDLDGHDQLDFYLGEILNGVDPLSSPLYIDNVFFPQPSACAFEPLHMLISYDDDAAVGWPNPDAPTLTPSTLGFVFGTTALQDEVLSVTNLTPGIPPFTVGAGPLLDEAGIHQSLAPNPDNGDSEDDDVDSLDVVLTLETCPVWLFSPDHEAYSWYMDINTGQPLDPGGIYEQLGAGPYKVVDENVHLGLPPDTDIDAFEFVWLPDQDAGGLLALALVFSVDEDDPLTSVAPWNQNESGGLDPKMLYYSFMTGWSAPLLVDHLDEDIDAVTNWPEPFEPGQEEEFVKWRQPPTINPDIHPDYFYGWNEYSVYGDAQIVADDWGCFDDRPVTDIHWWGSYIGWADPDGLPPAVVPESFHIGVWTDVPKQDPNDPADWSHPGTMIWEWIVPYDQTNERWVNFDTHPDHPLDSCFLYDFYIPQAEWFYQEPGAPNVYWLSIAAMYSACQCNVDVNGDGITDLLDLTIVTNCVQAGDCSGCVNSCDINCDGTYDLEDVAALNSCLEGTCDCSDPSSTDCCTAMGSGVPTEYAWGWKTRQPVWNDLAVAIATPTAPAPGIEFLEGAPLSQPGDPWDLAFVLTTDGAAETQACCLPDGTCADMTPLNCLASGGNPQGLGNFCSTPIMCLMSDGTCVQADPLCCDDLGGTPAPAAETPTVDCQDGLDNDCDGVRDCNDPDCATDPACLDVVKWVQLPDLEFTGTDVYAMRGEPGPIILADDFECRTTGPITEIAFWGSWYRDIFPHGDPIFVGFHLSFHDDIPASESPTGYSMPGRLLWEWEFPIGACIMEEFTPVPQEGFMWPPDQYDPFGDTVVVKYRCFLDDSNYFWQLGTPEFPRVYWLDVQALTDDPNVTFGWKTSIDHWNDDAVWAVGPPLDVEPPWYELIYPPGHLWAGTSIDLAFELVGREESPPIGACCLPDDGCVVTDMADCVNNLLGTFMGAGTTCGTQGACCYDADGDGTPETCTVSYQTCCDLKGGLFTPTNTCDPTGACCYTAAGGAWTCEEMAEPCCAAIQQSSFHAGIPCGDQGVCCYDADGDLINEACVEMNEACCVDLNGSFTPNATCVGNEACCLPGGACVDMAPACCTGAGGVPQGAGTDCSSTTCGPPEACCLPDGTCIETTYLTNDCADLGGDPRGPNTDCNTVVCNPIKWSQPPRFNPQSPQPECYWGWDELSIYGYEQIVADDWACMTDRPVSDIHWWGSYLDWDVVGPPDVAPVAFHIGLWTDVPLGTSQQPFSHPGRLVWEWKVNRDELRERLVGCDFHPDMTGIGTGEGCFRYDFSIPVVDWFWQGPECAVYWVSIAGIYDTNYCACDGDVTGDGALAFEDVVVVTDCAMNGDCSGCVNSCDINCDGLLDQGDVDAIECLFQLLPPEECCPNTTQTPPLHPWGWKTHRPEWNDDAVRIRMPNAPALPDADLYEFGEPIETIEGSWDTSFVLTTHVGLDPPRPELPVRDKSRFLSIIPGNPGVNMAIRVKCTDLSGYVPWNNTVRWVGEPYAYPDENSAIPGNTMDASMLECEPLFRDWITVGVVHLYGGEVVPLSTYEIQTVDISCPDLTDESCYSPPLVLYTGVWGDAVPPWADPLSPPQPDFTDINAIVKKFLADPGAPCKAYAQLQPNCPFPERAIDFRDISSAVDSFLGVLYSSRYPGPCTCPSGVTCGTACSTDADCGDAGYCRMGECKDYCNRCAP